MMRRSECITAVMVLPAAMACDVRLRRQRHRQREHRQSGRYRGTFPTRDVEHSISPDVKLVKAR